MKLHVFLDAPQRFRRDVFELVGEHIDRLGEGRQRLDIGVGFVRLQRRDFAGRTVGLGLVDVHAVTETLRRVRKHPAKLAATENTNRFAGRNHEGS